MLAGFWRSEPCRPNVLPTRTVLKDRIDRSEPADTFSGRSVGARGALASAGPLVSHNQSPLAQRLGSEYAVHAARPYRAAGHPVGLRTPLREPSWGALRGGCCADFRKG